MMLRPCQSRTSVMLVCHSPALLAALLAGCSQIVFQPAPVVPTKSPLPYSAGIHLTQIDAYTVEPGATMIADPNIENHVTGVSHSLDTAKKTWEKSVLDYLTARRTFTSLAASTQSDLTVAMRINLYIDPGVLFQFNHVYIARIEASLTNPRTGRMNQYVGFGKSKGDVSRSGADDDRGPINVAVQSALNDLFGKMENDTRLRVP